MAVIEMPVSEETLRNEIAKYVFTSKYARYIPELKRRETYPEAVGRVEKMHLDKFADLPSADLAKISWAFDLVREKKVYPSMRSMQFGGKAVEANNLRLYNCSLMHLHSVRSFSEFFYALLSGCGVGVGITHQFLDMLPDLVGISSSSETVVHVIEDSIEGWADALEVLLSSYFVGNEYSGKKIFFDYSQIRPAGAPLVTSGGKAPGPNGLRICMEQIEAMMGGLRYLVDVKRLPSIFAYDILMHASDAVLSGGVRRSACLVLFDRDDELMLNAKTGDWFTENPQRARSNNSVMLPRNEVTEVEFEAIFQRTKEWGEPGFIFVDDSRTVVNPCQPSWATVLTPSGIATIGDLQVGSTIWSEDGWVNVANKVSSGIKDVQRHSTTTGSFYGTSNHRVVSNGHKLPVEDADSIDRLSGPISDITSKDPDDVLAGLVVGDGTRNHPSGTRKILVIGQNDLDYFDSEISHLIGEQESYKDTYWQVKTDIQVEELPVLPVREIPERYFGGTPRKVAGFLRGLYSANGSIVRDRVTLKTTSPVLRDQVQMMLSSIGISSYHTTNKPKSVTFSNGQYECKESYDVNITVDAPQFGHSIGFIQKYKQSKLETMLHSRDERGSRRRKDTFDIKDVEIVSSEEVFDITVDGDHHTYWSGGLNVSNCGEVGCIPIAADGTPGMQMCNLTSLNGAKVTSLEDFLQFAEAASIIGTLQASYTDFPYLTPEAKEITEDEALLGVSILSALENPEMTTNLEYQRLAAQRVVDTNIVWAKKLGIHPAARCCVEKPDGTQPLVDGSMFSGAHGAEDRYMLRRIQANRLEAPYQLFKSLNPELCATSIFSSDTDDFITFPVKVPDGGLLKRDMSAIQHLDIVRSMQENWIDYGTSPTNRKPVSHSVSCTVLVKDDEWDEVCHYMYTNRENFATASFLPDGGSKKYQQAPMEAVVTDEDWDRFHHLVDNLIPVDYSLMVEEFDGTAHKAEASCAGGACELR